MNAAFAIDATILALASGRVAYSLVHDEIFRTLRENVWVRSAPEGGLVRVYELEDPGAFELKPAAMFHGDVEVDVPSQYILDGGEPTGTCADWQKDTIKGYAYDEDRDPRPPGFAGQIFECSYCMSFWISLLAAGAWLLLGDVAVYAAVPFALWAAANTYAVKGL